MFCDAFSSFLFSYKIILYIPKEKNSDIDVTKQAYSFNTRFNPQLNPL